MEIKFEPKIILSYKRLSYELWFALAEFIDNSTQAYFDNLSKLNKIYSTQNSGLFVKINYDHSKNILTIEDNSIGMDKNELENAVKIGKPIENSNSRSQYGLGMKTAACWLGDLWTIKTKKLGVDYSIETVIDVLKISEGNLKLKIIKKKSLKNDHYTIITIKKLHRKINASSQIKLKEYLRSIYRFDIKNNKLKLYFNNDKISYDQDEILTKDESGKIMKSTFNFSINGKSVKGWAGILSKGSRKKAGFSLIKNDRVIQGTPNGYRPIQLFGDQEGGRNDLVNQRLVGELILDDFEVSSSKDKILWEGDEEELLDNTLFKKCKDLKKYALKLRTRPQKQLSSIDENYAVDILKKELNSNEFQNIMKNLFTPNIELINTQKEKLINAIKKFNIKPQIEVKVNNIIVLLYITEKFSMNDPYLTFGYSDRDSKMLNIIINKNHPHWQELLGIDSLLNYLRHCAYDGISEWKAEDLTGDIKPDTIRNIKDQLLRIPLNINYNEDNS